MKQILFRGKRVDNGEWVCGYLYRLSERLNPFIMFINSNAESHEVILETVGQFTGLCDKNGNKIFEGDILETAGPDGTDYQDVVHFGHFNDDDNHGNEYIGFYVKSGNYTTSLLEMPLGKHNYCYVIGNIYDNPELLEDIK